MPTARFRPDREKNSRSKGSRVRRLLLLSAALPGLVFLVLACNPSDPDATGKPISLALRFDSLSRYDTLVIEAREPEGKDLGIIYRGKPKDPSDLEKLN